MIIYYILLFVVVLAVYHGQGAPKEKLSFGWMYIFASTGMGLVAGVRSRYVGTDACNYVDIFNNTRTFKDVLPMPRSNQAIFVLWLAGTLAFRG